MHLKMLLDIVNFDRALMYWFDANIIRTQAMVNLINQPANQYIE